MKWNMSGRLLRGTASAETDKLQLTWTRQVDLPCCGCRKVSPTWRYAVSYRRPVRESGDDHNEGQIGGVEMNSNEDVVDLTTAAVEHPEWRSVEANHYVKPPGTASGRHASTIMRRRGVMYNRRGRGRGEEWTWNAGGMKCVCVYGRTKGGITLDIVKVEEALSVDVVRDGDGRAGSGWNGRAAAAPVVSAGVAAAAGRGDRGHARDRVAFVALALTLARHGRALLLVRKGQV